MHGPLSKPLRIILVDDNPMIRSSICRALFAMDMDVTEACSADEALDLLERHPPFDMMVTDVEMRGTMNGIALANIVKERWSDIALLITSGCEGLDLDSLPAGAAFLAKPATAVQLIQMIHAKTARRSRPRAQARTGRARRAPQGPSAHQ